MKQSLRNITLFCVVCMASSCGFPGPIFKYNKEVEEYTKDGITDVEKSWDYFCFGYNGNFKGLKRQNIKTDSVTGNLIEISLFHGTNAHQRGGRKKTKSKTTWFDEGGKKMRVIKVHFKTYGRAGRERYYKEVEYLANGQKKITKRRATRQNSHKLEKIKYRGRVYEN